MYSRANSRTEQPIRIPEHYSGCAFGSTKSDLSPKKEEHFSPRRYPEPAKPTPPKPTQDFHSPQHSSSPSIPISLPVPTSIPHPQKEKPPTAPQPIQGLLGSIGSAFPFSHGLGFDELLIIGLILLLGRNSQDSDMILWLALLLFCG